MQLYFVVGQWWQFTWFLWCFYFFRLPPLIPQRPREVNGEIAGKRQLSRRHKCHGDGNVSKRNRFSMVPDTYLCPIFVGGIWTITQKPIFKNVFYSIANDFVGCIAAKSFSEISDLSQRNWPSVVQQPEASLRFQTLSTRFHHTLNTSIRKLSKKMHESFTKHIHFVGIIALIHASQPQMSAEYHPKFNDTQFITFYAISWWFFFFVAHNNNNRMYAEPGHRRRTIEACECACIGGYQFFSSHKKK